MTPTVRRARKKPVEIEYMVWPGGAPNASPVIDWVLENGGTASWMDEYVANVDTRYEEVIPEALTIHTLEGDMRASPGDVIIRGVKGEFYPCKPDIFTGSYDMDVAE